MSEIINRNTFEVPIVSLRGAVVFPHMDQVLTFGRDKSISAVSTSFENNRLIGIFNQKDGKKDDPSVSDLYQVGTLVVISQIMNSGDGIHAMVRGKARIKINEILAY